jgi:hypothetical protein
MYLAGGAWALGIDLPRSSRGQAPIFWISRAQFFRYSFELLQFQLGEKEREAADWGWEQEAGNSMFHLVNAYTKAAQFEGLPAEASYRLQKVGGAILGMVK